MVPNTRIAAVGCGFFAGNHFNAWRDLKAEGAELVAVCDIDGRKAEAAATKFGVRRIPTTRSLGQPWRKGYYSAYAAIRLFLETIMGH